MARINLVEQFPIVPSSASITDISTGRAFGDVDADSLFDRINPFSEADTYHWSSALSGKPSWAVLDEDTEILHVRAHDCPFPATPLHPTCYDCVTDELTEDAEFVFTWKTARAESLLDRTSSTAEPRSRPAGVDHAVRPAGTPLCELFEGPWTDVFGDATYELGERSRLLLQHCGACENPMDARLGNCARCVASRAPEGFPGADYVMFVKMFRPADGMERRSGFPGLHEARNGRAVPPRFGRGDAASNRSADLDDTGETKVFRKS